MKRALLSVSDKTNVVEFAKGLAAEGFALVSTGGTFAVLKQAGLSVTEVSEVTNFPECLDGRLKTLHPFVFGGLLAKRDNKEHMQTIETLGILPFDVVAVNLYPFKNTVAKEGVTLETAIENIDIGGPSMLRAAAKNYQDVAVVVDPCDYENVLKEIQANGFVSTKNKFLLAGKVFAHTAYYDAMIASYWQEQAKGELFPQTLTLTFEKVQDMRYGENPHQKAAYYRTPNTKPQQLTSAIQLHGKELSFNNINDTNGALELLREFSKPTVVACKHTNPCGVASRSSIFEAYKDAFAADPVSVFGGIVVANGEIDEQTAKEMSKTFLEIVLAPSFTKEALAILTKKPNLRLLTLEGFSNQSKTLEFDMKKVSGGLLVQTPDDILLQDEPLCVTNRQPTKTEKEDLLFAWKLVKHTKSNGIAIAKNKQSVGIGPGQVNRIWPTKQAIEHAKKPWAKLPQREPFWHPMRFSPSPIAQKKLPKQALPPSLRLAEPKMTKPLLMFATPTTLPCCLPVADILNINHDFNCLADILVSAIFFQIHLILLQNRYLLLLVYYNYEKNSSIISHRVKTQPRKSADADLSYSGSLYSHCTLSLNKNFFTDNYDHTMFDDGVQLVDMFI